MPDNSQSDTGKLDGSDFRRRANALGIRAGAYLAAHAVLVRGKGLRESARAHELDPTTVHRAVKRIREARLCECCGQVIREQGE